ncbi:MAG: hypothetical protein K2N12_05885 [Helicobacter sp.]|nr:hypothetical protein [Helicobacter sp.]
MIMSQYSLLNGTVFSAMQATVQNRDTSALANEEEQDRLRGLSGASALRQNNAFLVNDSNIIASGTTQVMFNDPKSGARVSLSLSQENFAKLQAHFSSSDFYQRQDGVVRLNGNAEAFVGGWFGDVAYRQNYLAADSDKNGRISDTETKNLKNSLFSTGQFALDGSADIELAISGYASFDARFDSNKPMTIEDALNVMIQKDKNLDGKLERLGEYETESEAIANVDIRIQSAIAGAQGVSQESEAEDYGMQAISAGFDLMRMVIEHFARAAESVTEMQKKALEQAQQTQEAMRKLQQQDGNLAALSPEERSALGSSSVVANKKEDEKLDTDELAKLQEEVDSNTLQTLSDVTGIEVQDLQKIITSSLDKRDTEKPLTELDKELKSVIDAIKGEVADNNVELFSARA